jgi:hypothetical protein
VSEPKYCPDHGVPDDPRMDWPCPLALEGDPPEKKNCEHFMAEMDRRMADMHAGNFYRLSEYDENGDRWVVGHGRLAGVKKKAWSRKDVEE